MDFWGWAWGRLGGDLIDLAGQLFVMFPSLLVFYYTFLGLLMMGFPLYYLWVHIGLFLCLLLLLFFLPFLPILWLLYEGYIFTLGSWLVRTGAGFARTITTFV